MKGRRAIISVHDKTGVVDFAKALARLGYEIVSTGGTAAALEAGGVTVMRVSDVTGFPEILGGRVKTLHPAVHAGILARGTPEHEEEIRRLGIRLVDIVAVNLYPFVQTVARPDVTLEDAVENIDIGGPTMVRAAAKNFERVAVITNPARYAGIVAELESSGEISAPTRLQLALEAFRHTAEYDCAIADFLAGRAPAEEGVALGAQDGVQGGVREGLQGDGHGGGNDGVQAGGWHGGGYGDGQGAETGGQQQAATGCVQAWERAGAGTGAGAGAGAGAGTLAGESGPHGGCFGDTVSIRGTKVLDLRYGENPHQPAAFYALEGLAGQGLAGARQVQGKPLSFNNILDADAALRIVREFSEPVAVVIKHTNPCGVAVGDDLARAYVRAREADAVSAFGSVVGLGGMVTKDVAAKLVETFVEVVLAWGVAEEAIAVLAARPNLRVLVVPQKGHGPASGIDVRWVDGGFLVQQADSVRDTAPGEVQVVTARRPNVQESRWLLHAMRVAKHAKSNAVVLWKDDATVGVGAGQMNRVGSVRIAARHAGSNARGAVMASDAFFPFRDGIDEAANAGATAIIQPGGSVRDKECIEAADEHGIAMVFTGIRHFRH
ncbi:MAG: bifunctional phosphoribosylaminoimidazolecarboxamide formyltransferase/IMP cyclohydrolase [Bacillota bacterium]|nr:bifunctional phosphoribosylaminoimidazolecarboxamide formyltransferase/IMP cyclohydrolase [Bacillota bacterium]